MAIESNNSILYKAIKTFQDACFPDDIPKKTGSGRVGASYLQQKLHDEVKEVEDEDVLTKTKSSLSWRK